MTINEWIDRIGDRLCDSELGLPDGTLEKAAVLGVERGIDPGRIDEV